MDFIYFYDPSRGSGTKQGEKGKSVITILFEERYKVRSLEPNHY